jgi:hypothetical protein
MLAAQPTILNVIIYGNFCASFVLSPLYAHFTTRKERGLTLFEFS